MVFRSEVNVGFIIMMICLRSVPVIPKGHAHIALMIEGSGKTGFNYIKHAHSS